MRQLSIDQFLEMAERNNPVIAAMLREKEMSNQNPTVMSLPELGKNAKALKKANYQLNESEAEKYCCAISYEVMDDPVIDPTTLQLAIDPNASEQFLNYHDVPRYERKSLEKLIGLDGTGKSPNTRIIFTAAQLVPDTALRSTIDTFVKRELEKYEALVTHHVFGELYFKLEKSDSGLEPYRMCVILKGQEIANTCIAISEKNFQFLSQHCDIRNIFDLEDFFSDKGYTCGIIKNEIEKYRRSLTHHVIGDLSFMIEPSYIKDWCLKQRISIIKNKKHLIAITFGNTDIAERILSAGGNIAQLKINLAGIPTFVAWIENAEAEVRQNQECANLRPSLSGMFGVQPTQMTRDVESRAIFSPLN